MWHNVDFFPKVWIILKTIFQKLTRYRKFDSLSVFIQKVYLHSRKLEHKKKNANLTISRDKMRRNVFFLIACFWKMILPLFSIQHRKLRLFFFQSPTVVKLSIRILISEFFSRISLNGIFCCYHWKQRSAEKRLLNF